MEQKCATFADSFGSVSSWKARGVRVEAEVELILPAELEARLGQRIVADLRARMTWQDQQRARRSCK